MNFTILYSSEPEWGYTAEVVELPWCVSYGETLEEAKIMIEDAAVWYLQSLKKHWENFTNFKKSHFISSLTLNETI